MKELVNIWVSEVQKYLRAGKTIQDFEREHGIRGKTDGQLLILDYDQFTVNWSEPYGWVCRGLVLDARTFNVISLGLHKFMNWGQDYEAPINWSAAAIYDKIDGTMVNRFWNPYTNSFEWSTRFQLPENIRQNTATSGIITWQVLIDRCSSMCAELLEQQPKDQTWVFEVCCPENIVVVQHTNYFIKLLAARSNCTLEEISLDNLPGGESMKPKSYQFSCAQEVVAFANTLSATEHEGFVVCDSNFNRIKIKSDEYLRLHRLKDGLTSIRGIINLARGNDYEEVITRFPQYKGSIELTASIINDAITTHEAIYEQYKDILSQKEFALTIQKCGLRNTSALFLTRAKKQPSIRSAFLALEETPFLKLFKDQVKTVLGNKFREDYEDVGAT